MIDNLPVLSLPGEMILNALPDAAAVIDESGTIVCVNRAWQLFSEDNGGNPAATGVGVNYLQVCRQAAEVGDLHALEALQGIDEVPQVSRRILVSWKDANHAEEDRSEGQGAVRAASAGALAAVSVAERCC